MAAPAHQSVRALMFLTVGWASGSSAQSRSLIGDALSCPQCTITFRPLVTIGDTSGPGVLLNRPVAALRDGSMRLWVIPRTGPPLVFDQRGSFVGTVGRLGRGPGEFDQPIGALRLPGDSILVIDGGLFRATVIDPKLKTSRSIRMRESLVPGVVLQWPKSVILRGPPALEPPSNRSLHDVSFQQEETQTRKSFGRGGTLMRMGGSTAQFQTLAAARTGGLWSANLFRYELHSWTATGEHVESLHRRPSWFAEDSPVWLGNPGTPPPPTVAALQEDQDGLLWVFLRIPAENWRLGWSRAPAVAREVLPSLIDVEKLFDTMIEVIDPRAGAVLARERLPGYMIGVSDHQLISIYDTDAGDYPIIRVLEIKLTGRAEGSSPARRPRGPISSVRLRPLAPLGVTARIIGGP